MALKKPNRNVALNLLSLLLSRSKRNKPTSLKQKESTNDTMFAKNCLKFQYREPIQPHMKMKL